MPQANYKFEKRKRDLQKKLKQEAKRLRKLERKKAQDAGTTEPPPTDPIV